MQNRYLGKFLSWKSWAKNKLGQHALGRGLRGTEMNPFSYDVPGILEASKNPVLTVPMPNSRSQFSAVRPWLISSAGEHSLITAEIVGVF